jgi:hypothetical protein
VAPARAPEVGVGVEGERLTASPHRDGPQALHRGGAQQVPTRGPRRAPPVPRLRRLHHPHRSRPHRTQGWQPADHPLYQPDPEHHGYSHLGYDAAVAVDRSHASRRDETEPRRSRSGMTNGPPTDRSLTRQQAPGHQAGLRYLRRSSPSISGTPLGSPLGRTFEPTAPVAPTPTSGSLPTSEPGDRRSPSGSGGAGTHTTPTPPRCPPTCAWSCRPARKSCQPSEAAASASP